MYHYTYCAGVLPYCQMAGKTYFLLGKSRKLNMWTTFSGKDELTDESEFQTAAREFDEESLGVICSKERMLHLVQKTPIVLNSRTPRGRTCRIFVVQIPYSKTYAPTFNHVSQFLKRFDPQLVYKYTEIREIRWIEESVMIQHIKPIWIKNKHLREEVEWMKLRNLGPRFLLS